MSTGQSLTPGDRHDDVRLNSGPIWYERTSQLLGSLESGAKRLQAGAEEQEDRRRSEAQRNLDALAEADAIADALAQFTNQANALEERGSDKGGLVTIELASAGSPKVRVDPKLLHDPDPEKIAEAVQEALASVFQKMEAGRLRALVALGEADQSLKPIADSARARLAELEGTIVADDQEAFGSTAPRLVEPTRPRRLQ